VIKDFFRKCVRAGDTVDIIDCEKCLDTECPKNIPNKPWVAVSHPDYQPPIDESDD